MTSLAKNVFSIMSETDTLVVIWHCYFLFTPTEAVSAFSWEPGGSKFAIIHGESPRISASFYNMEKQGSVSLLSK